MVGGECVEFVCENNSKREEKEVFVFFFMMMCIMFGVGVNFFG